MYKYIVYSKFITVNAVYCVGGKKIMLCVNCSMSCGSSNVGCGITINQKQFPCKLRHA